MVSGYVNLPKEIAEAAVRIGDFGESSIRIDSYELAEKFRAICKLQKPIVMKTYFYSSEYPTGVDVVRFGVPTIAYSGSGIPNYSVSIFFEQRKAVAQVTGDESGAIRVNSRSY